MLIDNLHDYNPNDRINSERLHLAMRALLGKEKNRHGNLDLVTGFFTLGGLKFIKDIMDDETKYRMILAKIAGNPKDMSDKRNSIDILLGDNSIEKMFKVRGEAKEIVEFLESDRVDIRKYTKAFCHAKTYIYSDKNEGAFNCFITGSSNLTESGMGMYDKSGNIELNVAETGANSLFNEHKLWFDLFWDSLKDETMVHSDPEDENSPMIPVKQYFINLIKTTILKNYTPEDIYYKILFELFKTDIEEIEDDSQEMTLLQDSVIYKTLFEYQQKGVISLIKMLRKYNGAILADAVGLGKTFSALAVMKYFQNNGYTVLILCPKKLEHNWTQYKKYAGSRFERDQFDYIVRFHTDLQNDRLENYATGKLSFIQKAQKLLVVVDESHNLRNDKSSRYQTLLSELLKNDGTRKRDVKILQLSATPINNRLTDVRNQFNLIAMGNDSAFVNEFEVDSLLGLFTEAQKKFTDWCKKEDRTVGGLIDQLPERFFSLTDRLIVARTRKMIEDTTNDGLKFPIKQAPQNIDKGVESFGEYKSFQDIYDALLSSNLTAYKPSFYMGKGKSEGWQDDRYREASLVAMMATLFVKRLESSWYACAKTIEKVLKVHQDTLDAVIAFKKGNNSSTVTKYGSEEETDSENDEITLHGGEIKLSEMKYIDRFQKDLEKDVVALQAFYDNISTYAKQVEESNIVDEKLAELINVIREKQKQQNKKLVIFTAFSDTAEYLYRQLSKVPGFEKIACVTGNGSESPQGKTSKFDEILQRFAPYSKLFKEKDWSALYEEAQLDENKYYDIVNRQWNVKDFDLWKQCIAKHSLNTKRLLDNEIDILICTDCLSEGQNLQDADMQVNYDIHWNPVRLIQRFGRIDRIGSPNETIKQVNFWPVSSYDDVLNLQNRINNRMSAMVLVGSEIIESNDDFSDIIKDNPLIDSQSKKLLDQIRNNSISDIEERDSQSVGLQDFSLETYRQDIIEYLQRNKTFFENMPLGAYSGFEIEPNLFENIPESLFAVVGYPHRDPSKKDSKYEKLYLMCQPVDLHERIKMAELNKSQILSFLRSNKNKPTHIPDWLKKPSQSDIDKLTTIMRQWMQGQVPATQDDFLDDLSLGVVDTKSDNTLIEDRFKLENFDLLVWEYVTRKA